MEWFFQRNGDTEYTEAMAQERNRRVAAGR
jgi:hypothetical protein